MDVNGVSPEVVEGEVRLLIAEAEALLEPAPRSGAPVAVPLEEWARRHGLGRGPLDGLPTG